MALVQRSTPRNSRSRGRTFGLHLEIDRTVYEVRPTTCHPHVAVRAFELRKSDGTRYDVAQTRFGPECDCPDFIFRRAGLDPDGCKHIQALVTFGLIVGHEPVEAIRVG